MDKRISHYTINGIKEDITKEKLEKHDTVVLFGFSNTLMRNRLSSPINCSFSLLASLICHLKKNTPASILLLGSLPLQRFPLFCNRLLPSQRTFHVSFSFQLEIFLNYTFELYILRSVLEIISHFFIF